MERKTMGRRGGLGCWMPRSFVGGIRKDEHLNELPELGRPWGCRREGRRVRLEKNVLGTMPVTIENGRPIIQRALEIIL